jgi:hypothetical protein
MDKQDQQPGELREHVAHCLESKVEIMGVLKLIEAIGSRRTFDSADEQ